MSQFAIKLNREFVNKSAEKIEIEPNDISIQILCRLWSLNYISSGVDRSTKHDKLRFVNKIKHDRLNATKRNCRDVKQNNNNDNQRQNDEKIVANSSIVS